MKLEADDCFSKGGVSECINQINKSLLTFHTIIHNKQPVSTVQSIKQNQKHNCQISNSLIGASADPKRITFDSKESTAYPSGSEYECPILDAALFPDKSKSGPKIGPDASFRYAMALALSLS